MDDILLGIGRKLKEIRKNKGLVLTTVAERANVSAALVSKIENGRTLPSLPVLITLIQALEEDLSNFFRDVTMEAPKPYFVVRKKEYVSLEREESEGFDYQLIFNKRLLSVGFELVLLTVQPGAKREKTITDAFEFKYILEGKATYVIGDDCIDLEKGDAIYFDGRTPHNPQNLYDKPATMLVVYFFYTEKENK